jgi:hypothetical protein
VQVEFLISLILPEKTGLGAGYCPLGRALARL